MMNTRLLYFTILFLPVLNFSFAQTTPRFNMPESSTSLEGHVRLVWDMKNRAGDEIYLVEKSQTVDFDSSEVIYSGIDQATFVSGLPNGEYYFRVKKFTDSTKIDDASWSRPVKVTVRHHSLTLAFTLAAIGFVVFAATAVVVVKGAYGKDN